MGPAVTSPRSEERIYVSALPGLEPALEAEASALGWVPHGNTGGANVSPTRPMPIPADLRQQIDSFQPDQRPAP